MYMTVVRLRLFNIPTNVANISLICLFSAGINLQRRRISLAKPKSNLPLELTAVCRH